MVNVELLHEDGHNIDAERLFSLELHVLEELRGPLSIVEVTKPHLLVQVHALLEFLVHADVLQLKFHSEDAFVPLEVLVVPQLELEQLLNSLL